VVATFDVYLEDDRSDPARLSFVDAPSLDAARDHARRLLAQSPHHRSVSIRQGYQILATVTRDDDTGPTPQD
jgi:hypothetical protein